MNIALFASGNGSNAENIVHYFRDHGQINTILIASNNPEAYVLERAVNLDIPSVVFNRKEMTDPFFSTKMQKLGVDFIVLAGFLLRIPQHLIHSFPNKILNIHPALLPNYGGKGMYGDHVHRSVLENGDSQSGISIHLVNENYDEGQVIFQEKCEVSKTDTIDSLAQKIHDLEYEYFPQVIEDYILNQRS